VRLTGLAQVDMDVDQAGAGDEAAGVDFFRLFFSAAESEATSLPSVTNRSPTASRFAAGSITRAFWIQREDMVGMATKNTKRHKKNSGDSLGHQIFFYGENRGAKIYEQAGLDPTGLQVTQQLGDMLVGDGSHGLQFDDQPVLDEEIGKKFAQQGAIFVVNGERMLLPHFEALFAKPVGQRVLIYLFDVTIAMIAVDREAGFANDVTELVDMLELHLFSFW
jgi:hypothetical protein